ncbi:MAG: HAMP domain-containing histidine kinase [Clostridia bacterium]|nr:HAMP domain-containing histidine kinase [Clostridia bacterium]
MKKPDISKYDIAKYADDISKYTNKIIPQFLIQSIAVVITSILGSYFMTWLINDALEIKNTYLGASLELIGVIGFLVILLVPMNMIFYRSRKKEIRILSEGIKHLAEGDFDYEIPLKKGYSLAKVYANFNKMCEELRSVQMLRNDFINSYSHEFKTPIASINGFASLLLEKELSDEEKNEYLKIIIEETDRLSRLATNTILLSRLSSQKIVTDTQRYDISEQIRQCGILLSGQWMEKEIDFSLNLPPVMFDGNRELMQHLWINLISNAVNHTPKNGKITVSYSETKDKIAVSVSDTGTGMDENTKKHLFDPYFQGDSSRSKQGLGLGLSIVQKIVELCGGEISVESTLGEGSTFIVKLPKVN